MGKWGVPVRNVEQSGMPPKGDADHDEIAWWPAISTYWGYAVLIAFGYVRDLVDRLVGQSRQTPPGYAPIVKDHEDFYTRRLYMRLRDAFNRPICGSPGAYIDVLERVSHDQNITQQLTGRYRRCLNLGSYNYLGFGDADSPCRDAVLETLQRFSVSTCSSRLDSGTTSVHVELESLVAKFLGKPAAMVVGMGFGTNSTVIPALVGKGGLIVSDSCNHSSIIVGARLSGAKIKTFKHQDVDDLERTVRQSIIEGQPRTHRPWTKILVIVEGIYSMEGEICDLPRIVDVVKKYNCYLFVDEAHSIGALGRTGRGVCEHTGVDPASVDILMGTFTKSFGGVGGYIAGSQELIDYLRVSCAGSLYSPSISPTVCQQILSSMMIIGGMDGTDQGRKRLDALRDNANFFREAMKEMGCHVLGDTDSPVVPVMLCNPAKISAFSRECLDRNLAVVVVGFPATPVLLSRVRFCISAAHTRADLEHAIAVLDEVCDVTHIKYKSKLLG
ncbi:serine C-palmitoyltransferase [Plasmodiophora brassicae]|uniref:serine C-palmitoyltransferase n=1 Tax=Plasmodiophora brassicae TaxID=37360 RepID=A0A3P3YJ30_PLABS|nr:unnamed protein product [Plasmodiophora brassicae]